MSVLETAEPLLAYGVHTGHTSRLFVTGNINDQRERRPRITTAVILTPEGVTTCDLS